MCSCSDLMSNPVVYVQLRPDVCQRSSSLPSADRNAWRLIRFQTKQRHFRTVIGESFSIVGRVDTLGMKMAEESDTKKLVKRAAVLRLLSRLEERLGSDTFQIVDHWEGDLIAIGVAHPHNRELLVYIAANGPEDYYVELETSTRARE